MAIVVAISQPLAALFGSPSNFVCAVSNTGASALNVYSIGITATTPSGAQGVPCNIDGPIALPGTGAAQVNGSQFNVQVGAGATAYFPFSAQFFGSAVAGSPAIGAPTFSLTANVYTSDGANTASPTFTVNLTRPVFGRAPGSPPNQSYQQYGMLNFSTPNNSNLLL